MFDFIMNFMSIRAVTLTILLFLLAGISAHYDLRMGGMPIAGFFGLAAFVTVIASGVRGFVQKVLSDREKSKRREKQSVDEARRRRDFINAGKEK